MISKAAKTRHIGVEPGFQWRGDEITRIEGLSDAVFAFAVTLLVVSLEVPHTYNDLFRALHGLPGFVMTFAMLMQIWFEQYKFFRRYGLQDMKTVVLTLTLLLIVLVYVYPLKFLFNGLLGWVGDLLFPFVASPQTDFFANGPDLAHLMMLYNVGVVALYGVYFLLFQHAYKLREELQLNKVECFDTRDSMHQAIFFICLGIAGISIIVLLPINYVGLSGVIYAPACAFYFPISSYLSGKKRSRLLAELQKH